MVTFFDVSFNHWQAQDELRKIEWRHCPPYPGPCHIDPIESKNRKKQGKEEGLDLFYPLI